MKTITIKQIKCFENEDLAGDDEIRLEIRADGNTTDTLHNEDFNDGETWTLNKSYNFTNHIQFKMMEGDWPDPDDHLGTHIINSNTSLINAAVSFTKDDADYELLFDLIVQNTTTPAETTDPLTGSITIRQFFSRIGKGIIPQAEYDNYIEDNRLYRIGNEVISLRDTFQRHSSQDGNKSNTKWVRNWIQTHCNYRSPDTYIGDKPEVSSAVSIFFTGKNWKTVKNEKSVQISGFQDYSRVTYTDNPFTHETRDWNWDVIPDPQFMYLLGEGYKGKGSGTNRIPVIHNEWETGSFPLQWRPFWGEYLTFWGRHIWDVGHAPTVTEIHPAHTIIREHTSAAPIGTNRVVVPINEAYIGMGLSGGYPGHSGDRWDAEFGGVPDDVWGDTTDCWSTNLKKHPVKFKFYPPVKRPNNNATLKFNIKLCQHILVNNNNELDDFLELTQNDNPAYGGEDLAFRDWNTTSGFSRENTSNEFKPSFTLKEGPDGMQSYYDVVIDLSEMSKIPVGYHAIIQCGWNTTANTTLQKYEVTFKTIKALSTDEWYDDWHLYYGVNGLWSAWWTDDFVEEGDTYTHNKKFSFWTVDDMPIVIRDTGIEWDGTDYANEKLDTIDLILKGADHFNSLRSKAATDDHLTILSDTSNIIEFRVKGKGGDTSHQWKIKIEKK
ncbi:hypothetical protein [Aquimarina muelleri]|uniref:Uncharacterized protein n=1 Tax=Aquimarina muelleri TaxID=279356 RepID=A0A918JSE1_9FLAO|nr:hypothetical protein [Aquimarina muelleri]MCX2763086.1 hypothetical protein [Aquimarina muelleri]GGX02886.1 hypothetical protein GCM10007384_00780 [Aquimarina muelleri]